ncbi:hypothetical protein M9H77_02219 [Catharanthus roseus]|uniref:Uncharacterized protein n=1 Tax=Catharanthus roseus TaxID=4058 RepID=A0ACC0C7S4_CATRO|nr:hypothetical protein M9H77_02219 [Catharanthus roseus]
MEKRRVVIDRLLGKVDIFYVAGPNFEPDATYYNYEEAPNPEAQRYYDMLKFCDWFDLSLHRSLKIYDKYKLVTLHIKRKYAGRYDPFILSQQAKQVTYVPYPTTK